MSNPRYWTSDGVASIIQRLQAVIIRYGDDLGYRENYLESKVIELFCLIQANIVLPTRSKQDDVDLDSMVSVFTPLFVNYCSTEKRPVWKIPSVHRLAHMAESVRTGCGVTLAVMAQERLHQYFKTAKTHIYTTSERYSFLALRRYSKLMGSTIRDYPQKVQSQTTDVHNHHIWAVGNFARTRQEDIVKIVARSTDARHITIQPVTRTSGEILRQVELQDGTFCDVSKGPIFRLVDEKRQIAMSELKELIHMFDPSKHGSDDLLLNTHFCGHQSKYFDFCDL